MSKSRRAVSEVKSKKRGAATVSRFIIYFIVAFCLYRLILLLGERAHVMIYYVGVTAYITAIAVLFCIYYAKNGYTFRSGRITEDDLADVMTTEEKAEYIARREANAGVARHIMLIITVMVITVLVNYAELLFYDLFASLIK